MLERLLQMIAENRGAVALNELAARLGVSVDLVAQMIEQLVALGYLSEVEPGCAQGACRGCPQAGACALQPQARLWTVTAKGQRLLAHEK